MKPDPAPYSGELADIHGRKPYNQHLWPTEWYWMRDEVAPRINSMWNIGIIALADGRFSSHMAVWAMEANNARYDWVREGKAPIKCVFPTREEALRAAAAKIIRLARNATKWEGVPMMPPFAGTTPHAVIEWARGVVARESGKPAPVPRKFHEIRPLPAPAKTGLPLLDLFL